MSLAALDSRFPRKRAVITGGASGLGLAAAGLLAARGWKLALFDRDGARLAPRSFQRWLGDFRRHRHSEGG